MKKRVIIGIGIACLTAGIGLAGCGASSDTGTTTEITTTAEVTTTSETTTAEHNTTTTTEAPATTPAEAPTEAWRAKYAEASVAPKQNPDEVWGDDVHIEVRLNNGIHIYLPTLFPNVDQIEFGNIGYGIHAIDPVNHESLGEDSSVYYPFEKSDKNPEMVKCPTDGVLVGVHEGVVEITGHADNNLPSDDGVHKYREFAKKDGTHFYLDFTPWYQGSDYGYMEWMSDSGILNLDYYNDYADKIVNSAWVE